MGNLSTPKSVQKLQKALHAKAKAEAGYRFYALYDKISRDDILAHAYAQCRSNNGAPGVSGIQRRGESRDRSPIYNDARVGRISVFHPGRRGSVCLMQESRSHVSERRLAG